MIYYTRVQRARELAASLQALGVIRELRNQILDKFFQREEENKVVFQKTE